jgi:hypothetical protein
MNSSQISPSTEIGGSAAPHCAFSTTRPGTSDFRHDFHSEALLRRGSTLRGHASRDFVSLSQKKVAQVHKAMMSSETCFMRHLRYAFRENEIE